MPAGFPASSMWLVAGFRSVDFRSVALVMQTSTPLNTSI